MKLNTRILSSALCGGLLLSFSPVIFAEEVAAPEIAICQVAPDDDVVIDDKTVVTDDEVVIDKESDSEVTDEDGEVTTCWDPDWVKRGDGDEVIYYMTGGGPGVEPNRSNASDTAPVEADKDAAVTTRAEKSPKVNTVQRNTAKPNAVKSNGRVFLRK